MSNIYEKQIINTGGEPLQGVQPDTRARQMLESAGTKMQSMAKQIYAQELRNSMTQQMGDAYAEHQDDPAALGKALNDIRGGMISEIVDPDVLTSFAVDFDLKSTSMMANSRIAFARRQRTEHKTATNDALLNSLDELTQNAIGVFEDDDNEIKVGYMHARKSAEDAINTVGDNGLNIFTDAERKNATKQISKGALVGLQNFLADPSGDPARKAEIINRMNAGRYKDMFSAEDWPKALRLIKAAGKQYGVGTGTNPDGETVMGESFRIQLSDMKEKSGDDWYSNADLMTMLDFRGEVSDAYEKGMISDKESKDIMKKSAPAMLKKIEDYAAEKSIWGTKPMRSGLQSIQSHIGDFDLSDDQRLYIYEDYLRRYRAGLNGIEGDDSRNSTQRTMAKTLADDVIRDYVETANPNWDPKTSSAIVMGRSVYRTPESQSSPIKNGQYRIVKDADGNVYKQYRDINGNFSRNSITQKLGQ